MKPYLAIFLYCLSLIPAGAAETSAIPAQRGNRFLFVLETTTSMTRASKSAQSVLSQIIQSGALGQMHIGDTFGIWTYNDTLSATRFPMHQWAPDINFTLSKDVSDFLQTLRFEKEGDWNKVWAPLTGLIKSSRALTIVLITDGLTPLQGTPFDEEINGLYRQNAREMREARMPFVTALVVRNGDIVDYAVNSTLGPLHIPNPPLPRPAAPPRSTPPPVTNNAAPAVTPRPLAPAPSPVVITNDTKPTPPPVAAAPANPTLSPATNRAEIPLPARAPEKIETKTSPPPLEKAPVSTPTPAATLTRNQVLPTANEPVARVTAREPVPAPKPESATAPALERGVPAQPALVAPPQTDSHGGLLIPILLLGAGAIVVCVLLARRRRVVSPSLISRSMEPGSEPPSKK